MEITKNKLLQLIRESNEIEFDESKERKRASVYGEKTKYRPISIKDGIVLAGDVVDRFKENTPLEGVKLIGWEFHGMPIFYTKIDGFKELQQKDQNLWIKIKKLYKHTNLENIKFVNNPTIPKHPARGMLTGYSKFDPTVPGQEINAKISAPMKSLPASTKIKKALYGTVRAYFEKNPAMLGTFNLLTLPPIELTNRYMDMASDKEISNDKVVLKVKSGIGFRNQLDFQKTAAEKNAGVYMGDTVGEDDKLTKQYYLKRQYNRIYKNWPEVQKNNGEWLGKTKKYRLDRYNKSQNPYDVGVISELEVVGLRQEDRFTWTVTFKTKIGSDLLSGKGTYKTTKDINVTKTAEIEPGEQFNDSHSIVENPNIVSAMIEAIYDVAKQIQESSPSETLQHAIVPQFTYDEIEDFGEELNESIDIMIKDLIGSIR